MLAWLLSAAAVAQSPPVTTDPLCDLAIEGVTLASSDAEVMRNWGSRGLAHFTETTGGGVPGRPEYTRIRFAANPGPPDHGATDPLMLTRMRATNGQASLTHAQRDTVRVVQKTGERNDDAWRRWSFAGVVAERATRFCNAGDPRVFCRMEGSMPRAIEVRAPPDGRVPYCTYTLSIQAGRGTFHRSVVGEQEYDRVGIFSETLLLTVVPSKDALRQQRSTGRSPPPATPPP